MSLNKVVPLADRLIVLPCVEEKHSAIIIPDKYLSKAPKELLKKGVVVRKGVGTKGYPMREVKEGDVVVYPIDVAKKETFDEKDYDLIRFKDLVAIL